MRKLITGNFPKIKILFKWFLKLTYFCAALFLCLLVIKWIADIQFYSAYDSNAPLKTRIFSENHQGDELKVESTFSGVKGITVPLVSYYPNQPTNAPLPCVIFLHGVGQRKSFLKTISPFFTKRGYVVVCFDQYMCGKRKLKADATLLNKALAMRQRAALTVMETRRLIDHLENDPKIAPDRIYLAGASFGAMMGAIASAQEPRIAGTALIYGGGDWNQFSDSVYVRKKFGAWSPALAVATAFLMAPADPVIYAGQITPSRPLLIQNGNHDTYIPQASAEALIKAAGNQAKVIWYDSDHIGIDKKLTQTVLIDAILWLDKVDHFNKKASLNPPNIQ